MSSLTKVTLLLALHVAGMSVMKNACILGRIHVQITNQFENGEDLTLHCKSKTDDLGEYVLHKYEILNGVGKFIGLTFIMPEGMHAIIVPGG
ncbi:hypothetical protein CUMW_225230 [Citrus unshiu]|uniref:S-protein homolog n=1 Tax=Citrus unshiu TaxID=55188 RepID=A0A2H5QFI0_CITUN|nr:hypothetical protein CUMW_225230 [Citrus unshiu]